MPPLPELYRRPPGLRAEADFGAWFARVCDHLLNRTDLLVAGRPYRLAELEAYYHGPDHADPFAHRDPVQVHNGRWYFHRTGGTYRGGSFKGVDLTLGDGTATFGVLIRSVVTPDGMLVDGPSLVVDHLLGATGAKDVATLDRLAAARPAWDPASPLALRQSAAPRAAAVFATARVGLSLKRSGPGRADPPRFVGRPYRYLTEPRGVRKGRPQLVCALHGRGAAPGAIHALTGVPPRTVDRYLAAYAAGTRAGLGDSVGKDLGPADVCRLLGAWAAAHGAR